MRITHIQYIMYEDYNPSEIQLAHEIAATLNDRDSITLHLKYIRRYKEEHLRRILNKVMSIPPDKIKRSRAPLYTFLVGRGDKYGDPLN